MSQALPQQIFLDEYASYFGRSDDGLRELLRSLPGIPNATYLASGESVFVFDKLVSLVKARGIHDQSPLNEVSAIACDLCPLAHVPALEAVSEWSVLPQPYEVDSFKSDLFRIRHNEFNATIPHDFRTIAEVNTALALLLTGKSVDVTGDFSYSGQEMKLLEPLDPYLLPDRPIIEGAPFGFAFHTLL